MPLVSTIIPAYNAAAFIREAIDSALAQEGVEQEIIVVDDGSTDDTPQILAEYGDRIRVITQENRGLPQSRNRGARVASGEWLAFLDADDIWLRDKLRRQLSSVTPGIDLVFTMRIHFNSDGDCGEQIASDLHPDFCRDAFTQLLLGNPVTVSSVIMRAQVFHRLDGFRTDPLLYGCEDWDLWLRFAHDGGHFAFCTEALTRYRIHASSMSKKIDRMRIAQFEVLARALDSERGKSLSPTFKRRAYANCWSNTGWRAAPVNRWKAILAYINSFYYMPTNIAPCKEVLKCLLGRV